MTKIVITFVILLVLIDVYVVLFGIVYNEQYFPLNPDIDTKYAERFDEKSFEKVRVGMSKDEIIALIGNPLRMQDEHIPEVDLENGIVEIWWYTQDGACWWCNFAWIGREICLNKNGEVIEKIKSIHRD